MKGLFHEGTLWHRISIGAISGHHLSTSMAALNTFSCIPGHFCEVESAISTLKRGTQHKKNSLTNQLPLVYAYQVIDQKCAESNLG